VPIQLDRDEHIARFYLRYADELRRAIRFKARGLDNALIDDACAFAWEQLLQRPDIELERHRAYLWIYKIAVRQAWKLARAQRREQPAGGLSGADDDRLEPPSTEPDVVDLVAERLARATVRELLGELHWRERRELLLYAHGFSYNEIAQVTGTSYTAVNKWLARGKNALWEARARRDSGGTHRSLT
jgi:DNA-directed RNA polymerase specialized sigma24 family protein